MRIFYINISDIDLNNVNVWFGYSYAIFLERKWIVRVLDGLVTTFKWGRIIFVQYGNTLLAAV